ncbi:MAG: neutral zinc metallopeptidase [Caulobacterales bacterium]|nr:neutral zinc metallopeptidase [Caulobacterales bacterium]
METEPLRGEEDSVVRIGDRSSRNVEDRRGERSRGATRGASAGVPMLLFRFLFSRVGRRLLVPLLLAGVAASVIFGPQRVLGFVMALLSSSGGVVGPAQSGPALTQAEEAEYARRAEQVLATTEEVWGDIFRGSGSSYLEPKLVLYTGGTTTGCGFGQAAMGPFYCPTPERPGEPPAIYIDLSFFKEMETRMGAGGDFAQAYVVAHEVGHHVQRLNGVLEWSARARQSARTKTAANQVQVRVELMADCLAGVWAKRADALADVELERGDLEEAVAAAQAVGDDTLQRQATGRVVPDSFTHGSAEQRVRWFTTGFERGDPEACETRELPYERL